ncbi:MAG: hypothetical protein ACREEK_00900 [Bradyrhizobium sp.]
MRRRISGYFFALCGVSAVLFVLAGIFYFESPYDFFKEVEMYKDMLGIDPGTDSDGFLLYYDLSSYSEDRFLSLVIGGILAFVALVFAAAAIWSYIADDE